MAADPTPESPRGHWEGCEAWIDGSGCDKHSREACSCCEAHWAALDAAVERARRDEREACALIADNYDCQDSVSSIGKASDKTARDIAKDIRWRSRAPAPGSTTDKASTSATEGGSR